MSNDRQLTIGTALYGKQQGSAEEYAWLTQSPTFNRFRSNQNTKLEAIRPVRGSDKSFPTISWESIKGHGGYWCVLCIGTSPRNLTDLKMRQIDYWQYNVALIEDTSLIPEVGGAMIRALPSVEGLLDESGDRSVNVHESLVQESLAKLQRWGNENEELFKRIFLRIQGGVDRYTNTVVPSDIDPTFLAALLFLTSEPQSQRYAFNVADKGSSRWTIAATLECSGKKLEDVQTSEKQRGKIKLLMSNPNRFYNNEKFERSANGKLLRLLRKIVARWQPPSKEELKLVRKWTREATPSQYAENGFSKLLHTIFEKYDQKTDLEKDLSTEFLKSFIELLDTERIEKHRVELDSFLSRSRQRYLDLLPSQSSLGTSSP